jgi:two-component system OmpR family sensor kinase
LATLSRISAPASQISRFDSLRWRIATFYALLLVGVIAVVAVVLTVQLRAILLDAAQARIDSIGGDIIEQVDRSGLSGTFGEGFQFDESNSLQGDLDHWASPTTYLEMDSPVGYLLGKSSNMGGERFAPTPMSRPRAVFYTDEEVPELGHILVRTQILDARSGIVIKIGESLTIYDSTLAQVRTLLAVVVVLAAGAVAAGSYALASRALEPIDRLIVAMREIRSDQLDKRLGWSDRSDEIGELAHTFDAMLERLEGGFTRERQFISDASHELKTPLTIINANAQMLERWADRDPEVRADSLRAIREESAALAQIVNGMLLLAKAESGDGIPREPVALDAIVADAVRAGRPRAEAKSLRLNFVSHADAGPPVVYGDANLLRQLFTNLIDNAIKFTDQGHVDVSLATHNGSAEVEVVDTGSGIDQDSLDRVFDRFYRADKSRDRAVPGTGLGLAIVRSIARVHDGTVQASRPPAGGTAFHVTLPTLTPLS